MQATTSPNDRERLEHLMISAVYDDITDAERKELDMLLRQNPRALDELLALQDLRRLMTKPLYRAEANRTKEQQSEAREAFFDAQWKVLDEELEAAFRQNKAPILPESVLIKNGATPRNYAPNKPLIRPSELIRYIPRATERGFVGAALLLTLLIGGYSLFLIATASGLPKRPAINKMKLTNLPPPPTAQDDTQAPPPPPSASGPAARAGTPVPVPDALIAPDVKDFANVDEISRASTTGGDGNDQGYLGLASDVDTEVREDEPSAYDFIPVEKEPYVDIRELQKKVVYPDIAKRAGIEGKVNIRVLVGKNGVPKKHIIESSDSDLLNDAAVKAVMNSVFTPAIQNNQPIDCWVSIPIVFRLR